MCILFFFFVNLFKMEIISRFCVVSAVLSTTLSQNAETLSEIHLDVAFSLAEHLKVSFCVFEKKSFMAENSNLRKMKFLTNFLNFRQISQLVNGDSNLTNERKTMVVLTAQNSTLQHLREISENSSLSSAIWILFSQTKFRSDLFQGIYVPFDCEFIFVTENEEEFTLTEIYRIGRETEMETYRLGSWKEEGGLEVADVYFYSRRNDLKGHKVTAMIKDDPPYVSVEKGREGKGKPRFKGFLYEIWSELEFRLKFRTEFPSQYLNQKPEQVLKREEVDFALARISIVPSTYDSMEFSQPIHEAKSYMFGHRPGSELDWDSYLKPFSPNTWMVSIVWMLSSSAALALLYRKAWEFGTSEKEANYFIFTFSESLLTVFRAVCMQGSDVTPRSNACRLFFLSIYLTALVVTSAFSAALFSLLTIPKPRSPFNSLEEVLANNKLRVGFPSDPDFHRLVEDFAATLRSSTQKKLLEKLSEAREGDFMSPEDGIYQICRDKFYVFAFDLPNVLYLMQNMTRHCQDKILPSGPPLFTELIGIGFKKKNPYKELINFHLIRMKNEGILKRLLLNYWPPQIPTVQATWVRVTLSDISPILYMFALGPLLGSLFLYSEKILHLRTRKRKKKNFSSKELNKQLLLEKKKLNSKYSRDYEFRSSATFKN